MYLMTQQPVEITQSQTPLFKTYIFAKFKEWEDQQPGGRSNYTAYAAWLSENQYQVVVKQQTISDWIKGKYKPNDEKVVLTLVEKYGDEVYEILKRDPIDVLFVYVQDNWEEAPQKEKKHIAEIISKYSGKPIPNEARENSPTKPR